MHIAAYQGHSAAVKPTKQKAGITAQEAPCCPCCSTPQQNFESPESESWLQQGQAQPKHNQTKINNHGEEHVGVCMP
jgi:hypothetical protein